LFVTCVDRLSVVFGHIIRSASEALNDKEATTKEEKGSKYRNCGRHARANRAALVLHLAFLHPAVMH